MNEIEIIRKRIQECILNRSDMFSAAQVEDLLRTQRADGSWADLNYDDRSAGDWDPYKHLYRIRTLCIAYSHQASAVAGQERLIEAFQAGLAFWAQKKPMSRNWVAQYIGAPAILAHALSVILDRATPEMIETARPFIEISWPPHNYARTGQNLLYSADNTFMWACLTRNKELLRTIREVILKVLAISAPGVSEGLQADFSWHQHGPQLFNGGYGMGFLEIATQQAYQLQDTSWKFPPEKITLLEHYLLDGQRWMFYRNVFDYGTIGRGISRKNPPNGLIAMRLACQKLLSLKIHQRSRVEKLAKALEDPENFAEVEGNRHFWKSDFMVHRRKNYYTSVKMSSYRVWGSESGNGEGLQNYHVGDGLNLLMVDGKEYEEIFSAWDWKRLPGVTCEQPPGKLPEIQNWGKTAQGHTAFVGGVTDGLYGTAAFDLSKDSVQGRKTWFFFENEYVALGAGIASKSPHPVYTSINQCLLQGEVAIRQGNQTTILDERNPEAENPRWVHHRRVGYFLPPQNSVQVRLSEQTGSWHAINQWAADQPEKKKIFNLWLDHGIGPKEAEYSYVVVPDIERDAFEEYIANIPLRVLSNTPQLQAVYHKELGLLGAAFYEPGEIVISPQRKVAVDQPCLIQMQWEPQRIHLAVSNPVNQALPVTVRLPDHYDALEAVYLPQENVTEIHIPLPGDNLAGCSYIRWLEKHPS